jgi:3-isopropylmalate/(R)-2-methylmalate dehydratase small subunit
LPITLSSETIDQLFNSIYDIKGYTLTIDLENQFIVLPSNEKISFQVDAFRKHCLMNGLDDIGLTMQYSESIKAFEKEYYQKNSWLL